MQQVRYFFPSMRDFHHLLVAKVELHEDQDEKAYRCDESKEKFAGRDCLKAERSSSA